MNKIFSYFSEVLIELKKVSWPKRNEVIQLLSLVLVISAIVAIFIGIVDFGLTKALENLVAR
ncbi:MAG: Preprotein translocase, SecE subunit [Candidatus Woesebacteria bacterium GW2011_GWA1_33_30]|uniref:Protein translocase subunit SecE n=1 Tax=Candidatus Woesebacteria bacterium GW2011_GWA2_33_28 TaxID=1618561 RepID=A0A0G0C9T6_9BACT|nr:MAG: Preprotein translocase, SecE subunit [Candidatus Woesebacteria bacterium GW2011_GWA2_33_28]KKP48753.1 MAG: Preprotein translocase, SecE subunit [Candidatus Woesebacteria bacterium GW2011_GWA1_33_30]KKP50026.1 MAG: Preprotein translocase, SecE subunit [Microgenomates group bacterium GW2011_GWC1_33_32]KKP51797.1 MAG: Preprotein translocase, SecE subunit [Candidatus Woesebacteria bacterium GW2011_GWB1_33_38]KKP58589.1 MAG: Preprotein translocase, SecE subunit [Microgenomates group bacteriu